MRKICYYLYLLLPVLALMSLVYYGPDLTPEPAQNSAPQSVTMPVVEVGCEDGNTAPTKAVSRDGEEEIVPAQ